jgi:7,8-dihydropterin-6-yl-methyl-4-(beta-D-ribofuranosyl)aminobenzene 5'-phosphate synthase
MSGEAKCCAHHGLSILLTARVGGTAHSVIFDAEAGATVVSSPDARLLAGDCFYLSGEIPRVTPYEKGLPGQVRLGADGTTWEPDPWLRDERYLAVDVKSKGIVLFSMCSHAGIVNVLTDAKARFDPRPLHGAMGGFHLSGAGVEPAIPETILGLMAFGLKKLVPAHCTGWRALNAIARSVDERVLSPSAVGRRFVF